MVVRCGAKNACCFRHAFLLSPTPWRKTTGGSPFPCRRKARVFAADADSRGANPFWAGWRFARSVLLCRGSGWVGDAF